MNNVPCHGRSIITTPYNVVTENNIIEILKDSLVLFETNKLEIIYLDNYRKGITPILLRQKKVRPEINNKINVNFASMIVNFKVGYLLNEPVQYVARGKNDISDKINQLNDYMYVASKEFYDKELAEKFSVCGTAYRLTLPTSEEDEVPFKIYDIKSNEAFVVYYNGIDKAPLLGVMEVWCKSKSDPTGKTLYPKYCCYTKDEYFEIDKENGDYLITKQEPHSLGMIPLIEYANNSSRIGDFELVLPLLDAIDIITSNRVDGVEQFVQSLMKFINVDITSEDFEKLKDLGAIKIKSTGEMKADVDFITQQLQQTDIETLLKSLYTDILYIVGMPSVGDGNTSDSSNNGAVIMKNGWQGAETRAKSTELIFKKSEKEFLKGVLKYDNIFNNGTLKLSEIDIKLPRRNYENIAQKTTVLTQLLGCEKVHPKLAFESCGLFTDPEVAYILSKAYAESVEKAKQEMEKLNQPGKPTETE